MLANSFWNLGTCVQDVADLAIHLQRQLEPQQMNRNCGCVDSSAWARTGFLVADAR